MTIRELLGKLKLMNQPKPARLVASNSIRSSDMVERQQALDTEAHVVVQMVKAVNGTLLQYRRQDERTDHWQSYVYIVRPDETVADAVAALLVLTGANK